MKIDEIIASMPWARRNGPDKWMCKCPAHEDRSASLSISHVNGQTLVHCFAGCSPDEIMQAIGMRVSDLWDTITPSTHYDPPKLGNIPRHSIGDMFPILLMEAEILATATREIMAGRTLSVRDQARIILARYAVQDIANKYRGKA